jgi:endoglucanase
MKKFLIIGALLCTFSPAHALEKGQVVFQQDYEGAFATNDPLILRVPGQQGQVLQIERREGPSTMLKYDLPADTLRGARIKIEASVKGENITHPPKPWNGIKLMLHTSGPSGDSWPQAPIAEGTFDWKPARFIARVAPDTTKAELVLGLEEVIGKVWFDDVKVTVVALPRTRPQTPLVGPIYTGHDEPRLRGAMISTNATADDLKTLAGWGANHVRWQLTWNGFPRSPADDVGVPEYDAWLEGALKHVDELLPLCRELKLKVLVDIHTPPGGRLPNNECRLFKEKRFQEALLADWEKIARRYKGEKIIWGYDLVNEPVEGEIPDGLMDWHDLALQATKRIRAIDTEHSIIVEGAPWGGPDALADFEPLPFDKIVYSFHMYVPHEFTHQNVTGTVEPVAYPGVINGKMWDKEALRKVMQPVLDWQRDYNVQIYVGEFSAIRWAPGAKNYLSDVIDLFEENKWDWAYHAFREWPGWSVEHIGDKDHTQLSPEPTDRQKLLMSWFAKNQH